MLVHDRFLVHLDDGFRSRWAVAQSTVWSLRVVVFSPFFDDDLCLFQVVEDLAITEECPFNPSSPYAVSKTILDHLGFTYFRAYGMKVIRTRMFTYINPRREDLFSTSFALQVARIEAGLQKELTHGNLESMRTMIDVRDAHGWE